VICPLLLTGASGRHAIHDIYFSVDGITQKPQQISKSTPTWKCCHSSRQIFVLGQKLHELIVQRELIEVPRHPIDPRLAATCHLSTASVKGLSRFSGNR
jgi:hypothetical protein